VSDASWDLHQPADYYFDSLDHLLSQILRPAKTSLSCSRCAFTRGRCAASRATARATD